MIPLVLKTKSRNNRNLISRTFKNANLQITPGRNKRVFPEIIGV